MITLSYTNCMWIDKRKSVQPHLYNNNKELMQLSRDQHKDLYKTPTPSGRRAVS